MSGNKENKAAWSCHLLGIHSQVYKVVLGCSAALSLLDPGNSIQVSRDHTLPMILHQAGSWKCQLDKGKHPLYQGTSIPGGTDNPQMWSDLLGRTRN